MRKYAVFCVLGILLGGALYVRPAPVSAPETPEMFKEIDEIVAELTRISGMKALRKVECASIDKEHVKQFLEDRVRETVKPEEIRAEELTLKKFGLAPPGFDLKKTTIDLLTEQAAAFYDFRKKKLFVIDAGSDLVQRSALVHELAHALADQHFHLQKFIEKARETDDGALARLAVMEGQATWLMSEYLTNRTGQSLKDSPVLVRMMSRSAEVSAGQFPVFDRAPLYLRETLLFPYTQGMLFQHALIEKLGSAAFSEVFRHPPETTQQVLHPDKYLAHVKRVSLEAPRIEGERGYKTLVEGTFGELDHAILLRQYAGEKESGEVAPCWRAGQYKLLEGKKDKRIVLAYASEWETEEAARLYFGLYRRVLERKWKTFEVTADTPTAASGRGDDGYFLLRCEGAKVTSVEGLLLPVAPPKMNRVQAGPALAIN